MSRIKYRIHRDFFTTGIRVATDVYMPDMDWEFHEELCAAEVRRSPIVFVPEIRQEAEELLCIEKLIAYWGRDGRNTDDLTAGAKRGLYLSYARHPQRISVGDPRSYFPWYAVNTKAGDRHSYFDIYVHSLFHPTEVSTAFYDQRIRSLDSLPGSTVAAKIECKLMRNMIVYVSTAQAQADGYFIAFISKSKRYTCRYLTREQFYSLATPTP